MVTAAVAAPMPPAAMTAAARVSTPAEVSAPSAKMAGFGRLEPAGAAPR